jgi:ankyrin repeat protein
LDIVEILIKHNVDINQHGGLHNQTPIYYACRNGHTDIAQILLDNNCDIHGDAIHGAKINYIYKTSFTGRMKCK